MRPATAPAGSRMTASVSESQISSPPRRSDTSRSPAGTSSPDSRSRCSTSLGGLAERVVGRDAGDPLGGGVPEHDLALAVDGDDPVGDVGEDRHAALLLERDALVELGARERGRGVAGEGRERLDLLLAPGARRAAVDREHALDGALGADERRGHAGGVAGGEHRVGLQQALVVAGVRRPRPARATARRRRRAARSRRRASRARPAPPRPSPPRRRARRRRGGGSRRRRRRAASAPGGRPRRARPPGRARWPAASRCARAAAPAPRAWRSASNSSLRSSAPRAAPARLRASSRSSSAKRRSSAKKTSTSAHSSVRGASTGTASSAR